MTKKSTDKQADNRGKGKPWKKGQSGNPKGRPKKKDSLVSLLKEALRKQCPAEKAEGRTWAEVLTEQLIIKAGKGDMTAHRLIWEYVEGKPKQELEHKISGPINITVKYD